MILTAIGHRFYRIPGDMVMRRFNTRDEQFEIAFQLARREIENANPDKFISFGMIGFDLIAAGAALTLGVPTTLAVIDGNFSRRWSSDLKGVVDQMLSLGASLEPVSGLYQREKRHRQLHHICERADCAITLWDGRRGEVERTVMFALSRQVFINNVWEEFVQRSASPSL